MLFLLGGPRWLTTEDPTGHPVGMDTGAEGGNVVFVKVRETYDLCTIKNKMTVISIHTPKPDIIKRNFPGLLMQCAAYRPVSADVRVACASVQPLDPLGVGTAEGDIAPEDVFNPILYKAMSNFGMSQIEARINALSAGTASGNDLAGDTADVDVDSFTSATDEFPIYYGLLSNAHGWRHANPQAGLEMSGLRPLVYEINYNVGDQRQYWEPGVQGNNPYGPDNQASNTGVVSVPVRGILGNSKPMPFINTTSFTAYGTATAPGFATPSDVQNSEQDIPYLNIVCGCIIVPPSRLHQLFYRMVVEWTIEFSKIRPIGEITNWAGLAAIGNATHLQNYDYSATKEAVTGEKETILENETCMVDANVEVNKVM